MKLAAQQAALVRALVADGPTPVGFDQQRIAAARAALLAKRCGEIAHYWPLLLESADSREQFRTWASGRPKTSSVADGFAFAEALAAWDLLPPLAEPELRTARVHWRLVGNQIVRRSRLSRLTALGRWRSVS